MKTKIIFTIIAIICILTILQLTIFANELTLTISTNKEEVNVDDEIKIKVSWDMAMQAADFELNYDTKKVEYLNSNIDDIYVNNNEEKGIVKTSWISLDNTDKTEIEYTFKIKKCGKAKFTTTVNGGFATATLETPTQYNNGELMLKVSCNHIFICIAVVIAMIVIVIFLKKIVGGK